MAGQIKESKTLKKIEDQESDIEDDTGMQIKESKTLKKIEDEVDDLQDDSDDGM